jgi:hypothetical protein
MGGRRTNNLWWCDGRRLKKWKGGCRELSSLKLLKNEIEKKCCGRAYICREKKTIGTNGDASVHNFFLTLGCQQENYNEIQT